MKWHRRPWRNEFFTKTAESGGTFYIRDEKYHGRYMWHLMMLGDNGWLDYGYYIRLPYARGKAREILALAGK